MIENKRMLDLEEDRDYYKTKCASLETGMFNLEKENEQLKSRINDYDVALKTLQDLADKKLKENEQLKQQEKRLYKYFRKCFDNVSEQGFRETWEVVKKYD